LLFAAAVIAYLVGEKKDAAVVLVVVFINAIIGTVQEGRAERSMASLQQLSAIRTRVRRGGEEFEVEARELVPGDIVLLAAGDAVAADARLFVASSLESAEAALTGESLPIAKCTAELAPDTGLADRQNMVFNGTHITAGRGEAVVIATGTDAEVGRIATMTQSAEDTKTPLEKRIDKLGRYLVILASILFGVVVLLGYLRGFAWREVLMVAISQVVSMIPEGLPVAVTVALAVGMQRMAARGAVVRRLSAVETLGSTTVICSDKTGTLTRNEMTVTRLMLGPDKSYEVSGSGYEPEGQITRGGRSVPAEDPLLKRISVAAMLCNDADVRQAESGWIAVGDPTEAALITFARKTELSPDRLRKENKRVAEIPFDSATKYMATAHQLDGNDIVFAKGAPEVILGFCDRYLDENGETRPLTEEAHERIKSASAELANGALRLLAFAESTGPLPEKPHEGLRGAVFLGLTGQMDPPREEAKEAVKACLSAGIRPVMVTGDHKATGLAVARLIGIADEASLAVDGRELEAMPEEELRKKLGAISVFARVHPAQKLRIVEAFQARSQVVAMTGDGVNDAPALAQADVGVAMGITGTEVAKGAAKIVIGDDNFATIVRAVEQGRLIYGNIKKVMLYLFTTSIAEILVLLTALIAGYPMPLAAVQILWINIVTDGAVTINLIMEPPEGDEMKRPPTPVNERIITGEMLKRMALMAPTMVISTFGWFAFRLWEGIPFPQVQTETFTVLAVTQWFNVMNCRSATQSAFTMGLFKNPWLIGGLSLGAILHTAVVFWEPLNAIFHTVPVPLSMVFIIAAVASPVLWVEEIRKWLVRRELTG
jgi:Ca2+-transporting ATPase